MDCPHRTPPSGTLVPHYKAHRNCHARLSSRHHWQGQERRDLSRSQSRYSKHNSSSHCDLHRGHSRLQQWDRHNHHRSSSRYSQSAHCRHSHRPHHDTPHWSHYKSPTCHSSSGYYCQDCNRLHSQPPYQLQLSKYSSHQKGSCSSGSYPS